MAVGIWDISNWDQSEWGGDPAAPVPPFGNYTELIQGVIDQLKDSQVDFAQARSFIVQGRSKIEQDLLKRGEIPRPMVARGTSTTNDQGGVTVPPDFIRPRSMRIGNRVARYVAPEKIPNSTEGYGDQAVEMDYIQRIPELSDANPINWVLALSPNLYLYAACLFYVPWSHEPEVFGLWNSFYQDALDGCRKAFGSRPRGNINTFKGRPFNAVYTITGDQIRFGGLRV